MLSNTARLTINFLICCAIILGCKTTSGDSTLMNNGEIVPNPEKSPVVLYRPIAIGINNGKVYEDISVCSGAIIQVKNKANVKVVKILTAAHCLVLPEGVVEDGEVIKTIYSSDNAKKRANKTAVVIGKTSYMASQIDISDRYAKYDEIVQSYYQHALSDEGVPENILSKFAEFVRINAGFDEAIITVQVPLTANVPEPLKFSSLPAKAGDLVRIIGYGFSKGEALEFG